MSVRSFFTFKSFNNTNNKRNILKSSWGRFTFYFEKGLQCPPLQVQRKSGDDLHHHWLVFGRVCWKSECIPCCRATGSELLSSIHPWQLWNQQFVLLAISWVVEVCPWIEPSNLQIPRDYDKAISTYVASDRETLAATSSRGVSSSNLIFAIGSRQMVSRWSRWKVISIIKWI